MFMYVYIYVCMLYTSDVFLSPNGIITLIYKIPQKSSTLIGLGISGRLHKLNYPKTLRNTRKLADVCVFKFA